MPGTNYDNDHSFIALLSFELREVCYFLLCNSTLSELVGFLRGRHSIPKKHPQISSKDREMVFYACLSAKVTCIEPTPFFQKKEIEHLIQKMKRCFQLFYPEKQGAELIESIKQNHIQSYEWVARAEYFLMNKHQFNCYEN